MKPTYLKISSKELKKRVEKAWELLNPCRVCPRNCGVNRQAGEKKGFCRVGRDLKVSLVQLHFGEERPLVGKGGSGTIFFSSCNLACVYCQNYEISQLRLGRKMTSEGLGRAMVKLQKLGAQNINFVSPTVWVLQILRALAKARDLGLKLPLVYNTGGYDSKQTLKLLDGVIDIYMPDIKYADEKMGQRCSLVADYWLVAQKAVREMHRQVGDLKIDKNAIAQKGLLVRHLVLPNKIAGTGKVMRFLASLSKNTYVNIMAQYYPSHRADQHPRIDRRITREEYQEALEAAKKAGLHRFDKLNSLV